MTPARPLALLSLAAAASLAAGCGGGSSTKDKPAGAAPKTIGTATAAQGQAQSATTGTAQGAGAKATVPVANPTDLGQKPQIGKPQGRPPGQLVKDDLLVGTGPVAKQGDTVTVQYVGVNFSNGKQFDASWDRGQPFTFPLGAGQVIAGWDQGVAGMKVGGRRELVIPPDLGYGAQGAPPDIPANETLVFVIDLKRIG